MPFVMPLIDLAPTKPATLTWWPRGYPNRPVIKAYHPGVKLRAIRLAILLAELRTRIAHAWEALRHGTAEWSHDDWDW